VLIGSGVEKRGLIMAIWESKLLKDELGSGWVFDGNRLAW
jgi:eukaryotic translation initiation factor 2C